MKSRLTSALTEDFKQHEVSKKLTQALAVNGVTTLLLKASANTRGPDGDRLAWPSGHSSSAFTVAAVINEYYGPLAGIPSLVLAGFIGYQRIDSRRHDFSDVIFGGMLGYIIGSSIARDGKADERDNEAGIYGERDLLPEETAWNVSLSTAWSWSHFNLRLGLQYGNFTIPEVNIVLPGQLLTPVGDIYWRF